MPTFRISTWETEYKNAYIDVRTDHEAKTIALESLRGERADVDWDLFDYELGDIEVIEVA
ncbi:MAG: hypothetical protein WD069_16195 [Planctomycetales bacterium]